MGNFQCQWVRDRLPLLAGDELRGTDLRRVERHLIGCAKCREHRSSLDQSLNILHMVAAQPLVPSDAPSLWPELARQIRHSRRPAQTPLFTWPRRLGLWPAFGLGLGLVATVIAVGARNQVTDARKSMASNTQPIATVASKPEPAAPVEIPASTHEVIKTQGEVTASTESVPATRLGYDLDHTMPMPLGNESREGKQATY
ncbi:Putative zinc-finger [Singulisphaera sp. GP187]|uniref:zf-HC2 domain-containing protein n=1 Tax=Singulisphaera sp. GP187 TaxID=1882752 RepID=UPI00092A71F6|nr:zf-HC2 domain-containing protein [Singulisphaera sp. GP187]SIO33015.1 Putative zinc-finger [Singulisphaera sp. GP187]